MVEMLLVICIITVLVALLFPAINAARNSARRTQCQSNLRQMGVGLLRNAEANLGLFCSGVFYFLENRGLTQEGWVADLVGINIPFGQMTCPSNNSQLSETYIDLLEAAAVGDSCDIPRLGRPYELLPDGSRIPNPCRQIVTEGLAPNSAARATVVEQQVFDAGYNTNYTASWFLVRGDVLLDDNGNYKQKAAGCGSGNKSRNVTAGPLTRVRLDNGLYPASAVPLLGDGAQTGRAISVNIGSLPAGSFGVATMTGGPVRKSDMQPIPPFADPTPEAGDAGWFKVWSQHVRQDYRAFAPLHGGSANILFGDGGVRSFNDTNGDGLLNTGFPVVGGFTSAEEEVSPEEMVNRWSLSAPRHYVLTTP